MPTETVFVAKITNHIVIIKTTLVSNFVRYALFFACNNKTATSIFYRIDLIADKLADYFAVLFVIIFNIPIDFGK